MHGYIESVISIRLVVRFNNGEDTIELEYFILLLETTKKMQLSQCYYFIVLALLLFLPNNAMIEVE